MGRDSAKDGEEWRTWNHFAHAGALQSTGHSALSGRGQLLDGHQVRRRAAARSSTLDSTASICAVTLRARIPGRVGGNESRDLEARHRGLRIRNTAHPEPEYIYERSQLYLSDHRLRQRTQNRGRRSFWCVPRMRAMLCRLSGRGATKQSKPRRITWEAGPVS